MADKFSAITYAAAKKMAEASLTGAGAIKGQKGDKGDTGATGPQGEKGDKGDPGKDANIKVGNVSTASTPSVTSRQAGDVQYLDFALVKGEKGDAGARGEKGDPGPQGQQGLQGPKGNDGAAGPQGAKGADGKSFTIQGDYATVDAMKAAHPTGTAGESYLVGAEGDNPEVWIWEDGQSEWYNYGTIKGMEGPQGPKGDQGEQGPAGPQGVQGPAGAGGAKGDPGRDGAKGADGFTPTVTAVSRDNHVALTITNADGNATVEIPHGDKGEKGDQGEQGVPGVTLPDNIYSTTEEVVVGKWIDGKPIYRKALDGIQCVSIENRDITAQIPTTFYLTALYGVMHRTKNRILSSVPLSYGTNIDYSKFYITMSGGKTYLHCRSTAGWENYYATLIFEYTKTTDAAAT